MDPSDAAQIIAAIADSLDNHPEQFRATVIGAVMTNTTVTAIGTGEVSVTGMSAHAEASDIGNAGFNAAAVAALLRELAEAARAGDTNRAASLLGRIRALGSPELIIGLTSLCLELSMIH
jgi:hypothetical protein